MCIIYLFDDNCFIKIKIRIDTEFGEPGNGKYVGDVINARDRIYMR